MFTHSSTSKFIFVTYSSNKCDNGADIESESEGECSRGRGGVEVRGRGQFNVRFGWTSPALVDINVYVCYFMPTIWNFNFWCTCLFPSQLNAFKMEIDDECKNLPAMNAK